MSEKKKCFKAAYCCRRQLLFLTSFALGPVSLPELCDVATNLDLLRKRLLRCRKTGGIIEEKIVMKMRGVGHLNDFVQLLLTRYIVSITG